MDNRDLETNADEARVVDQGQQPQTSSPTPPARNSSVADRHPFRQSVQSRDLTGEEQKRLSQRSKDNNSDMESGSASEDAGARTPPNDDNLERKASDEKNKMEHSASTTTLTDGMSLPREILMVSILCMGQFMTQVGLGGTLTILHVIGDDFGLTDPADLPWLIAGYSLTVGTFILIAGRLGDIFGHKRMFILGFCWFSLWAMVGGCSVYSNHVLFTFARVLQGIGPSFFMPNAVALLGQAYNPGPRKAMAFAAFGGCAPGGAIMGAAFAGLFAMAWWPWTYWSLSLGLLLIAALAYIIIPDPGPSEYAHMSMMQKFKQMDVFGGLVGVASLVLFNFAWNQAPAVGWHQPYVIVTLILGVLLAPAFLYIELKVAKNPLIPFDALTSEVAYVLVCISCGWGCFGIWIYYLWQFLETLRHSSPLLTAAWFSPAAVIGFIASGCTGLLLGRVRPAWVMVMAMCAFTAGTIIIATAPVDQIYWAQTFVCLIVLPFGMDMSFPAGTLIMSDAVEKKAQGIAASLVTTVINYSISLGLGFAGTVEGNVNNGGKTPEDLLKGYRGAWYMGIGLAGLGLAVSILFLLKDYWAEYKGKKNQNGSGGEGEKSDG